MKKVARALFICLFTLLQCVAPLAHAHIDGQQGSGGLHTLEFEYAASSLQLSHSEASTPDSPAIGMPHELPRDSSAELAPPPPLATLLTRPDAHTGEIRFPCTRRLPVPVERPFDTPFSHAPPALA